MNRSTGLLRAYCDLLRRVSGAQSVSVYAPAAAEANPVFLTEGEPLLPELATPSRARDFAAASESLIGQRAMIESAVSGWLTPVPSIPFGRASQSDERRRAAPGGDEPRHCWIGLRFEESDEGRSQSAEAFERLRGLSAAGTDAEGWSSLLGLGGVLAWYAWQISSILDDPVTGLAGRTEFQARLSQAYEEAKLTGRPLSLLFANPDHFTSVNERFGHDAGDRVLKEIGERLRGSQRSSDSIAKYGGAIFASFLTDTDLGSARIVAEKVWTSLSASTYLDGTLRLGISLGVAVFEPGEPAFAGHLELIRRADKALNAAKRLGGGHIVCWEPELDSKETGYVDRMTGVYTGNMSKDYRNMTLLSDTMTVVAGSADVEELAEQVVERLFLTLKADHVGVFEWDENGAPVLLDGMSKRVSSNGGRIEPVNRLVLGRRQIALLEDAERERKPIIVSFADEFSDRKILSFAVPFVLGDACLGCLYIDGREDSIALEGPSDLGFLRAFATQLAVALDRARLSERQQRAQDRERFRLRAEVDDLRRALQHSKLSYRSPEMESVLQTVSRVAPTKATVLVIGESGTGKELVARTIHELSPFRRKPIVVVDCGAIPMTLIESELFGHERGAYTGAQERRVGRLLEAEGGTVVLDEIGELPLEVQSKLLRFVQERQVVPVGGTRVRHVDTRLIAVTNRELSVEAAAGRFREDLYYRLNVVRITVPPLRERVDDILHLACHFLEHFAEQYQKATLRFSEAAIAGMLEHHWPGNVRELQNRIMQAVILSESSEIGPRELELEHAPPEQTREMDLSAMKRSAAALSERSSPDPQPVDGGRSPEQVWEELRLALRSQVEDTMAGAGNEPLPLGTWLIEDLVLEAYRAAGEVSGRARALLGIPETTFRRKLQKATSQERAGLLTRRPPWNDMALRIAALVRTPDVAQCDVLHAARVILLAEVMARTDDPTRGAALMGVTVRTFRRWTAEMDPESSLAVASLA